MRTAHVAGALHALAFSFLIASPSAHAGPADYVLSPIVEHGEKEIDFKAGTARRPDGSRESAYSLGFGYGVTERWFTEFYGKWHKEPGLPNQFDAWEWENRFQLTETGKYPVDLGFLLEIERPQDRTEGYEYRWGPLLQADLGTSVQANLNLLFEKHVRALAAGPAELSYQWQLKYRYRPAFEFGVQGFGGVGAWDHWDPRGSQSHVAGPAVFGKLRTGQAQAIRYNAALLLPLTAAAPHATLRLQAEYEF